MMTWAALMTGPGLGMGELGIYTGQAEDDDKGQGCGGLFLVVQD